MRPRLSQALSRLSGRSVERLSDAKDPPNEIPIRTRRQLIGQR